MALASLQDNGLSVEEMDRDGLPGEATQRAEQENVAEQEQPAEQSGQFVAKWTLKILSGVHLGAEIPLYQGSTRLGKGENNDIVLSGDNLPDHLATLVCSEQGILVEEANTEQLNYLAGQPFTEAKQAVSPFEVITLGVLHLVYGPKNEAWPDVELPELQQPVEEAPDSDEPLGDAENPQQQQVEQVTAVKEKKRFPALLFTGLLGLSLVGCGSIYLGLSSAGSPEIVPMTRAEQARDKQQQLQQALTLAGLTQVQLSQNKQKNTLTIDGFVADNKQQDKLKQLLGEVGYPVKANIRVLSQLFNNLGYLLKVLGYPDLTVNYGEQPGDFVIGGYMADNSRWADLKSKLERDVAGVGHIKGSFDTLASRAAWLKTRLSEAGLDNLALAKQASAIVVRGEIAAGSLASWQQIEQEFNQRYLGLPKLEFSAQRIEKTIQEIKGVSLGAVPYIITTGGKRVITGGKLEGGYLIESIGPDRVVLSKAGKAMIYLIGGQHNE